MLLLFVLEIRELSHRPPKGFVWVEHLAASVYDQEKRSSKYPFPPSSLKAFKLLEIL